MRAEFTSLGGEFGELRLHRTEWGDPASPRAVVCVHGLTRNARDFDALARALSERARVLCVDVAGRGRSDWLADPAEYRVDVYARHLLRLLELEGLRRVDWVGTSMGGLIGMAVASAGEGSPIERLVLNDIGPFVPKEAVAYIGAYVGLDPLFRDLAELEAYLRRVHAPFGPLTDEQWAHLARHSARVLPEGVRLSYDPAIRIPFAQAAGADIDVWALYDRIACPTLVLRGAESGLLTAAVAEEMGRRGPRAALVTFPGVGHAPALMAEDQIAAVRSFLGL
jgi:pimeloyl-ACP methyl ester carboxylesterase